MKSAVHEEVALKSAVRKEAALAYNTHEDMNIFECYVQELPFRNPVSEPVDYAEIAFFVPIFARRGGEKLDMIADIAARHYVEKRGHPGRDNVLKVTIKYNDDGVPITFVVLRFD